MKDQYIQIRIKSEEKEDVLKMANLSGFKTYTDYFMHLYTQDKISKERTIKNFNKK
jgi:hypothetical protein